MIEGASQDNLAQAIAPRAVVGRRLPLEKETARFVLVSGLDLMMTWLLIRQPHFTEANPLALFFLGRWGIAGLVWFKVGMVAFVGILTQTIARQRTETARRLLDFATVLCSVVVVYGFALWLRYSGSGPGW